MKCQEVNSVQFIKLRRILTEHFFFNGQRSLRSVNRNNIPETAVFDHLPHGGHIHCYNIYTYVCLKSCSDVIMHRWSIHAPTSLYIIGLVYTRLPKVCLWRQYPSFVIMTSPYTENIDRWVSKGTIGSVPAFNICFVRQSRRKKTHDNM